MMFSSRRVKRLVAAHDLDRLVGLLANGSRRERRAAARGLGELGDPRAVKHLDMALRTAYRNDEDLPPLIVTALGNLNDSRAVEPVKNLLDDRRDDDFYFLAHREALFVLADRGEFDVVQEVAQDASRDIVLRGEAEGLLSRRERSP
jgi:HEAT repeat protein